MKILKMTLRYLNKYFFSAGPVLTRRRTKAMALPFFYSEKASVRRWVKAAMFRREIENVHLGILDLIGEVDHYVRDPGMPSKTS